MKKIEQTHSGNIFNKSKLINVTKSNTETEKYLKAKEIANELHTRQQKNFTRRKVISNHPNEIWAMDLCEITDFPDYKFILTIIDVYTKYGRAVPLKNKKGSTVSDVLNNLIKNSKTQPLYFWCDKGKEFYNKHIEDLCKKYSIKLYSTESEIKCSVIERWNRTLKEKMEKQLTLNNLVYHKNDLTNILQKIVYDYNDSVHSTIKMKPFDAIKPENLQILQKNWKDHLNSSEQSFSNNLEVNDYVRIYKYKTHFEKGYKPNWTTEIFKIKRVNFTFPIVTYTVQDLQGEEINGGFYKEELLKTTTINQPTDQDLYEFK
jgi:Integrase core domain